MAREFGYPMEEGGEPTAPLLWVSHAGFLRATGEELRTPLRKERMERLRRGLGSLDRDFPSWLQEEAGLTEDGVTLRFQDLEATRNVAAKLRDRGLNDR